MAHSHGHDHSHTTSSRKRLIGALAVTALVFVGELIAAYISGSLSLAADAGHMAVDSSGLVIALLAAHLSLRPRDNAYTWGWARSEVIAAALQAGMLLAICLIVAYEAVERLWENQSLQPLPMLVMGVVGLLANLISLAILAGGRGGISGRFVLIGVGVGAAVNSLIIMVTTFANTYQVREAMVWLSGSLASATWQRVSLLAALMVVLVPLVALRRRNLEVLEVGDDLAAGLGARPVRDTMIIVALVVALIASATAAAGPIAFVSFVSGPLALRLTGRWSLTLSALTGVVIVLLADAVGQILPSGPYPVGLITGALGAPVLLSVLLRKGN